MKTHKQKVLFASGMAIMAAVLALAPEVRGNVYATNIKLNGSLAGTTNVPGGSVTISYILNEAATRGVSININSNATVLDTINIASGNPGTLPGPNAITWGGTNSAGTSLGVGTYSVSITAAATGYTNWRQISTDGSNTVAFYPRGMAVDKNTNSPYYGRVVIGCAADGTASGVSQKTGLYKANADGSPADEGAFAYAGYTENDSGATASGEMPSVTGSPWGNPTANPDVIRIGEDDRIYWADGSFIGAIIACDMLGTTNQVVITSGPDLNNPNGYGPSPAFPASPNNYSGNPDVQDLDFNGAGIQQFDVVNADKTNAAIYLADLGDYPNWGIWMYRLVNGAADPNDNVGCKAVVANPDGTGTDLITTGAGVSVDYNQDIFVSALSKNSSDSALRTVLYTKWNSGVLPPEGSSSNYAVGITGVTAPYQWAIGSGDDYMSGIYDTVLNSRSNPTMLAISMYNGASIPDANAYGGVNGGIRIISTTDGSTIVTNLDISNWYLGIAWDNVGNLYGAICDNAGNAYGGSTTNHWRVWSPPGTNVATTVAVPQISFQPPPPITITSISVTNSTVTITFNGTSNASASAFKLYHSTSAYGPFSMVTGTTPSQISSGVYQVTTSTSGSAQFYCIYGP